MIQAELSIFDAAVLGIMILSCLFAFFRGFVREVLSLGSWIGAGLVTLYYFESVAQKLQPHFKNEMAATGVATIGLYALSLICFSILTRIVMKFVKSGADVGLLDNFFGLLFGGLRGAFIVALAYLMIVFVIGENTRPEWMRGSFTLPYVIQAANTLKQVAPNYLKDMELMQQQATQNIHTEESSPEDSNQSMNRLIEGIREEDTGNE